MKYSDYIPLNEQLEAVLAAQLPDETAAQELVMGSMQNAVKYLSRVSKGGKSEDELISLCYAALVKAVRNFKPEKGRFFPYAKVYLRSALFSSWKSRGAVRHAETISEGELIHINISDRNQEFSHDDDIDTCGHDSEGFGFDAIDTKERWAAASAVLLKVTTEHERTILQLRFTLDYSFERIAGFMGTTRSAAQGSCERALRKIRAEMGEESTLS